MKVFFRFYKDFVNSGGKIFYKMMMIIVLENLSVEKYMLGFL